MNVLIETEDVRVRYVEREGHVFLHLDVFNWTVSGYKALKKCVSDAKDKFREDGHNLLFATTDDEKITKLWERIEPLEELEKFGPHKEYFIGAWWIGEDSDGS